MIEECVKVYVGNCQENMIPVVKIGRRLILDMERFKDVFGEQSTESTVLSVQSVLNNAIELFRDENTKKEITVDVSEFGPANSSIVVTEEGKFMSMEERDLKNLFPDLDGPELKEKMDQVFCRALNIVHECSF